MASKPSILSESEIGTRVRAKAAESVGWYDSKLSREREKVLQYYNGVLPKRQHDGSSSYTSTDVYDAVESLKAMLLETFAGGDDIAQFDPDQDMNASMCRVATEYASYVIFRENDGFKLFGDVIHDGLTARVGVAKVFWDKKYKHVEETFDSLSHDEAMAVASHDSVAEFDGTHAPETDTYSGSLTRTHDVSKVTAIPVAPEEFRIAPRTIDPYNASFCEHCTPKTKAELLEMGYPKAKVETLPYSDIQMLDYSPEVQARNEPVESAKSTDEPIQDDVAYVLFSESYVRMRIDPAKGVRLYKVCRVLDTVLEYEEVDRIPFLFYVPLPVPHMFYGNNFAARVVPTQNARTVLVRAVLDHTAITTNPRYQVVNGGLMNPREMLENRMGGLVNVRRPDSVAPLPQATLNPFVFEVLGLLKDDKEQSTGISALSQGLNKDAISKQNSAALVDNLMTANQQRAKIAARNFAYGFFVPLMLEVIRLVIENEDKQKIIEVGGGPLNVNPQDWTERKTCTVSMHLGYGERDQAAMKLANTYKELSSDPAISTMFTVQNRYEMIRDGMKLANITRGDAYITSPDKVQPPQPDPFKTKELDIKDKLAQAALMQGQAANDKNQKSLIHDGMRIDIEKRKLAVQALDSDRTNDRQDAETAARIDVAQREMALEESMPDTSRKAIVSPRP